MATDPRGFEHRTTKDGSVRISHHGRVVAVLAGAAARRFLDRAGAPGASELDRQHLMARATGHYRHGNER